MTLSKAWRRFASKAWAFSPKPLILSILFRPPLFLFAFTLLIKTRALLEDESSFSFSSPVVINMPSVLGLHDASRLFSFAFQFSRLCALLVFLSGGGVGSRLLPLYSRVHRLPPLPTLHRRCAVAVAIATHHHHGRIAPTSTSCSWCRGVWTWWPSRSCRRRPTCRSSRTWSRGGAG